MAKPVGTDIATEVTVPPPPPATVSQLTPLVAVEEAVKTFPSAPIPKATHAELGPPTIRFPFVLAKAAIAVKSVSPACLAFQVAAEEM